MIIVHSASPTTRAEGPPTGFPSLLPHAQAPSRPSLAHPPPPSLSRTESSYRPAARSARSCRSRPTVRCFHHSSLDPPPIPSLSRLPGPAALTLAPPPRRTRRRANKPCELRKKKELDSEALTPKVPRLLQIFSCFRCSAATLLSAPQLNSSPLVVVAALALAAHSKLPRSYSPHTMVHLPMLHSVDLALLGSHAVPNLLAPARPVLQLS